MKRLHTYKLFKINESITEQDKEWNWNFTNFDPEDIETYIETLLKSYKIKYRHKEINDPDTEEHVKTFYRFYYKKCVVIIEIDFHGPLVFFRKNDTEHTIVHLDSMKHLNREIIGVPQSDVNGALLKMNEDTLEEYEDDEKLPDTVDGAYDYMVDILNKSKIEYRPVSNISIRIMKNNLHISVYEDGVGVIIYFALHGITEGYTYTKEGFMRKLLDIYNVNVGDAMKQINENVGRGESDLPYNFTGLRDYVTSFLEKFNVPHTTDSSYAAFCYGLDGTDYSVVGRFYNEPWLYITKDGYGHNPFETRYNTQEGFMEAFLKVYNINVGDAMKQINK